MARRPWTEEERKQISERMKRAHAEGRAKSPFRDPNVRKQITEKLRGRPGRKWTPEQKERASQRRKAKIAAGELDISGFQRAGWESCRGKPLSKEHKNKTSAGLKHAYAEGRKKPIMKGSSIAQKISQTMKEQYATGARTPPTTLPGVGSKIAKTKRENPHLHGPETRKKISKACRKAIKEGRKRKVILPPEHYQKLAEMKRGKPVPQHRRDKIAASVKKRWEEGAFAVRHYTTTVRFPGHPTPTEELIAPSPRELGFEQQLVLTTGKRKPSGHLQCYYYDFAHQDHKLIIEIDGSTHLTPKGKARDLFKEYTARNKGFAVLRFTNEEVITDPEAIIECVRKHLTSVPQ